MPREPVLRAPPSPGIPSLSACRYSPLSAGLLLGPVSGNPDAWVGGYPSPSFLALCHPTPPSPFYISLSWPFLGILDPEVPELSTTTPISLAVTAGCE